MNDPSRAQSSSAGRPRRQRTAAVVSDPVNTGYVPIFLQNATGARLKVGDMVAVDYATGSAFNGSATEAAGIILTWMAAVANIPSGAVGPFGALGVMRAKITLNNGASVAPGTWLGKDLTTGSLSLHSLGLSLASNNQPAPPSALAYLAEPATITTAGVYRVYFPGGPRTDWPSATWFEFFEDFITGGLAYNGTSVTDVGSDSAGVGIFETWAHGWQRASQDVTPPGAVGTDGGIIALDADSTGLPAELSTIGALSGFVTFVDPTDCMLEIRCAQKDAGVGVRRFGLWGTPPSTSLPNNGIILNHSAGNEMNLVIRSGAASTTLNTGFLQADAEFATWRVQHDSAVGAFLLFRNGVYVGRAVSDVPVGSLGPGYAASTNTASAYLDFIRVRSRR